MYERFVEAFIGVTLIDVLSNEGNGNFINWLLVGFHNIHPILQLGASCPHLQQLNDFVIKLLLVIDERNLIEKINIQPINHSINRDIGEQGNLLTQLIRQRFWCPADQHIWLNSNLS